VLQIDTKFAKIVHRSKISSNTQRRAVPLR